MSFLRACLPSHCTSSAHALQDHRLSESRRVRLRGAENNRDQDPDFRPVPARPGGRAGSRVDTSGSQPLTKASQATGAHRAATTPKRTSTPGYTSMRSRRSCCPGSRLTVNLSSGQRSDAQAANAPTEVSSTSRCCASPTTSHGLAGSCSMTVQRNRVTNVCSQNRQAAGPRTRSVVDQHPPDGLIFHAAGPIEGARGIIGFGESRQEPEPLHTEDPSLTVTHPRDRPHGRRSRVLPHCEDPTVRAVAVPGRPSRH